MFSQVDPPHNYTKAISCFYHNLIMHACDFLLKHNDDSKSTVYECMLTCDHHFISRCISTFFSFLFLISFQNLSKAHIKSKTWTVELDSAMTFLYFISFWYMTHYRMESHVTNWYPIKLVTRSNCINSI